MEEDVLEQDERLDQESKMGQFLQNKMQQLVEEETNILEAEQELNPNIVFRNYVPHDSLLATRRLETPSLNISTDSLLFEVLGSVHDEIVQNTEIQLVPTKQNWDLKRDLMKKLKILNIATQKAIIEIRNETMQEEEEED